MGLHGGLNISHQKDWHVYNLTNRAKVQRDEENADRDKERRVRNREAQRRGSALEVLRQRRGSVVFSEGRGETIQPVTVEGIDLVALAEENLRRRAAGKEEKTFNPELFRLKVDQRRRDVAHDEASRVGGPTKMQKRKRNPVRALSSRQREIQGAMLRNRTHWHEEQLKCSGALDGAFEPV